jgi:anti-sigma B factor antagonist
LSEFSIQAAVSGRQCDISLSGEIDLQTTDAIVQDAISQMADNGIQRQCIDLGAVTFMDATGLGALVAIRNAINKQGKQIVLVNVPDSIRRLLDITALDTVFAFHRTFASATNLT